jgi:hypothetical protein
MSLAIWEMVDFGGQRVFCIGMNKTGTTSLRKALGDLDYQVGSQRRGELLIDSYARRDFRPIVRHCRTAQAFQDNPFWLPFTFQILEHCFPRSKFILSVRDDEDQWYRSLVRFHSYKFGDGKVPTVQNLKDAAYCRKGWMWKVHSLRFDLTEHDEPYDESILKHRYRLHNQRVVEYFRGRPDFLLLNVADHHSYQDLCSFLNREPKYERFPWENRTDG